MTSAVERLLPDDVRAGRGQWSDWRAAPAVTASDIRRWAIAVYWPEPPPACFLERDAADPDRGIVAPQELNPFTWLPRWSGEGATGTPVLPGVRRLFGGCRIEYGVPIREGDVVRRRSRLDGWTSKHGAGGEMLLVHHTHEWQNQHDEVVRRAVYTLIHRGPVDAAA